MITLTLYLQQVSKHIMATKDNLSFLNSLWCSAAYYLGQGPDGYHPVSGSGRVSVAVWWFCITILGATYTANLAAYLTTNRLQTPIWSVEDLIQQTSTEYGVVKDSQTRRFFATSVIGRLDASVRGLVLICPLLWYKLKVGLN